MLTPPIFDAMYAMSHLIYLYLIRPYGRGCYVSTDQTTIIWVGAEDHVQVRFAAPTSRLEGGLNKIHRVLQIMTAEGLEFVNEPTIAEWHGGTGPPTRSCSVTSNPALLGTGMTINVIYPLAAKHATKLVTQVLQPLGLRADWVAHSTSSATTAPAGGQNDHIVSYYNICVERQFGKDPVGLVALVHNALTSLRQTAAIAEADISAKASVPGANDTRTFPNLVPRRRSLTGWWSAFNVGNSTASGTGFSPIPSNLEPGRVSPRRPLHRQSNPVLTPPSPVQPPTNYGSGADGGGSAAISAPATAPAMIAQPSPPRAPRVPRLSQSAGPQPGMSLQEKQAAAAKRHNALAFKAKADAEARAAAAKAEAAAASAAAAAAAAALLGPNAGKQTDLDHLDNMFAPANSGRGKAQEDLALTDSSGTESDDDDDDDAATNAVNITRQANTMLDSTQLHRPAEAGAGAGPNSLELLANSIAAENNNNTDDEEVVEGFGFDPEDMSSPAPAPRRSTIAELDLIHMPEMISLFVPSETIPGHAGDKDLMVIDQARAQSLVELGNLASFSPEVQEEVRALIAAPHRTYTEDEVMNITMDLEEAMEKFTAGMTPKAPAQLQPPSTTTGVPLGSTAVTSAKIAETSNFNRSDNYTLTEPPATAFSVTSNYRKQPPTIEEAPPPAPPPTTGPQPCSYLANCKCPDCA